MIAVSRVTVTHDGKGGIAPDSAVGDHGTVIRLWAGHRLLSENIIRPHRRPGRPIIFCLLVSEGIAIRVGCQMLGSMVRALDKLPEWFEWTCFDAHDCRLRHLAWNQRSCGLTTRLRATGGRGLVAHPMLRYWTMAISNPLPCRFLSLPVYALGSRLLVIWTSLVDGDQVTSVKRTRLTRHRIPGKQPSVPGWEIPAPKRWTRSSPSRV